MTHPYEQVFPAYQRRLRGILGNWPVSVAEDAIATAWAKAVEKDIAPGHLLGWLIVTARREAGHIVHQDHRRVLRDVHTSERADGDPAERVVERDVAERRKIMVRRLKPQQRTALFLSAAGYSMRDLSLMIGTGTGTLTWANRHLGEGRKALREMAQ